LAKVDFELREAGPPIYALIRPTTEVVLNFLFVFLQ